MAAQALQPTGLGSDTYSAAFSCVTLGKLLSLSVPLFEKEHSTSLIGL